MQGFSRLFRASNYTPNPADEDKVKERGKEMVEKGFAVMDKALAGKDYVAGAFSIADSALFYVEFWGADAMNMKLPPNCAAHLQAHAGAAGGATDDAAGRPATEMMEAPLRRHCTPFRSGSCVMARPTGTPQGLRKAMSIFR